MKEGIELRKGYFMKKLISFLVLFILTVIPALADINFDISVFENSGNYDIEFDDMDDTGTIQPKEGNIIMGMPTDGEDDEGALFGYADIRITEGQPPVIRLSLLYIGEEWIFTDDVILKPADTRYTFEVNRSTDVDGGKIYESFTIVITDENISLIKDIAESNTGLIRCRLAGDRDVDLNLIIDPSMMSEMYELYVASGALNNDFSKIKLVFPCTVK